MLNPDLSVLEQLIGKCGDDAGENRSSDNGRGVNCSMGNEYHHLTQLCSQHQVQRLGSDFYSTCTPKVQICIAGGR